MVNFPVNGTQAAGYLAEAKSGQGSGVMVLQERWQRGSSPYAPSGVALGKN